MKQKNTKIWVTLIVIGIIAIGGYFFPNVVSLGSGGEIHKVIEHFAGGFTVGVNRSVVMDGNGNITKSPDGFMLWDDFTVATTSPVRAGITNTGSGDLMCDGDSLYVYTDATGIATSFKFAVGTTSTALPTTMPSGVGYSANLLASTSSATSTDAVTSIPSAWAFLLPSGSSVTLSVGDNVANASSTYYGNWAGQFGVHCWNLGQ
jgi:hypothetical protein